MALLLLPGPILGVKEMYIPLRSNTCSRGFVVDPNKPIETPAKIMEYLRFIINLYTTTVSLAQ